MTAEPFFPVEAYSRADVASYIEQAIEKGRSVYPDDASAAARYALIDVAQFFGAKDWIKIGFNREGVMAKLFEDRGVTLDRTYQLEGGSL